METFNIYMPIAKGKAKVDKVEIFAELIPKGKENAIKRDDLTQKCVEVGLIGGNVVDKDRAMRKLMHKAKAAPLRSGLSFFAVCLRITLQTRPADVIDHCGRPGRLLQQDLPGAFN